MIPCKYLYIYRLCITVKAELMTICNGLPISNETDGVQKVSMKCVKRCVCNKSVDRSTSNQKA